MVNHDRIGRRDFLDWCAVLLSALGAGSLMRTAGFAASDRVTVGCSLPLTGPEFFVEDGLRQLLGYRLWREDVNRRGGLLGRPVKLVVYDDGASADGAAKAYRRLIDEGADLLLGNYGSGAAAGVIPVVESAEIPGIFPMAWQPQLWLAPHRWAVPTLPLATEVTRPLVEYLAQSRGVRRVAVINAESAYARDLTRGLVKWVQEFGIKIVFRAEYAWGDPKSLKSAVQAAVAAGPDALAGGSIGDQVPELAEAVHQAGGGIANYFPVQK